jgi:SAM-dependent methyltransferase
MTAGAPDPQTAYFDTRLAHDPRRARVWHHLTRYLSRFVPKDACVLELGAGYAYFINSVPARRRIAVDTAPEMLRWKGDDVEGFCGDALDYLKGASSASTDFILASNFFEHFEWPVLDAMIREIVRVLNPGGRLAVIQPNFRIAANRYFDDYTHRAIFTDVSLSDWLRTAGLRIHTSIPRFLPLTIKSRAADFTWLMPLYLRSPLRPLAGQMFVLAEKPDLARVVG